MTIIVIIIIVVIMTIIIVNIIIIVIAIRLPFESSWFDSLIYLLREKKNKNVRYMTTNQGCAAARVSGRRALPACCCARAPCRRAGSSRPPSRLFSWRRSRTRGYVCLNRSSPVPRQPTPVPLRIHSGKRWAAVWQNLHRSLSRADCHCLVNHEKPTGIRNWAWISYGQNISSQMNERVEERMDGWSDGGIDYFVDSWSHSVQAGLRCWKWAKRGATSHPQPSQPSSLGWTDGWINQSMR